MSNTETLNQLTNALASLKQANAILDSVLAGWSVPEPPEQPPFIDTLTQIKDQGTHAADVAGRLLTSMKK